jgi:hypothetical protein
MLVAFLILLSWENPAWTQDPVAADVQRLSAELEAQAVQIRKLQEQLDQQGSSFGTVPKPDDKSCTPANVQRLPLVIEVPRQEAACNEKASDEKFRKLNYYVDYDKGWVVRPFDPKEHPFSLKANGWIQFRHHAFASDVNSWTDNAGVTRPVLDRNTFDIERARIVLSGSAIDQRLTYFLQLDGDTDGEHAVDFFDYWWGWEFSDRFEVQVGKRKVPASRQWLLTARKTRFVERPMSNDFFRPDRTLGIFGVGKFGETGNYEVMFGNGYSSSNDSNANSDDRYTVAATSYFDPLGDYGGDIVDYDGDSKPVVRLGHSFVFSPQKGNTLGVPLDDATFLRLTDGTRLTQIGALAPGVTVSDYDIYLYGVDAAIKWNGWSANAEFFARWIEQISGNGPLPVNELFQYGYYVEGGRFLVPQKLDVNARYSQVSGDFGTSSEYAAGFNWYPLAKPTLKMSFDVTTLDGSPLQNTASDILVGDDGVLFRTQLQAEF